MATAALAAGAPLFFAMPPWCDVTLYQMAARNVLNGGVHYRDIFDTNLPGFVWAMAAAERVFGRNYEALRAVDLLVIAGAVAVLGAWVRRCGGTGAAVAWLVAAVVLFYPFASEFNHIQRDPWMLLPAALAARLRLRRVLRGCPPRPAPPPERAGPGAGSGDRDGAPDRSHTPVGPHEAPQPEPVSTWKGLRGEGASVFEGFLWGAAVWLKPHVVVPALAVWAVSVVFLARREPARRIAADWVALLAGGLLAGAPGVAWLVATGAWPHFLDIFLNWNPAYLADAGPVSVRFTTAVECHRPWGLVHVAALPLAALALWEGRVWSRAPWRPGLRPVPCRLYHRAGSEPAAAARALLAALYLGWMVQVVCLQKSLDYVQVPLLLLAFAVVAAQCWCFGFAYFVWFVGAGTMVNLAEAYPTDVAPLVYRFSTAAEGEKLDRHVLADRSRMELWGRACAEGGTPELRDRIGQYTHIHCATTWTDLTEVARYLRTVDPPIGPGELNCWHDSTHPLYLLLDVDPATRYMHYGTAFGIKEQGPPPPGQKPKREQIADAVRASKQRYVVSDLLRTNWDADAPYAASSWRAGDPLPVWLPAHEREAFPWNQPVVFRAGRYVVHRVDPNVPLGLIRVPDWDTLDELLKPRDVPPQRPGIIR